MPTKPLTSEIEKAIKCALKNCWSNKTGAWTSDNEKCHPSSNQCIQTALVIYENFDGEILRTTIPSIFGNEIDHFYNRIGGQRYDFTAAQFDRPEYSERWADHYKDILSNEKEAFETLNCPQFLEQMRLAFDREYKKSLSV